MASRTAREAIFWTRDTLGPLHLNALLQLRPVVRIGPDDCVLCVHDSPTQLPTNYVHDRQIASMAFHGVGSPITLVGHTHVPMVFETEKLKADEPTTAVEIVAYLPSDGVEHELAKDRRYICNPGSVGQPRDCDPRASFAVLDLNDHTFTVYREEYDIRAAQEATEKAGLPIVLAERLAVGA